MTVSRHESKPDAGGERAARPIWFWLVVGSTAGFLVSLLANLASTLWVTFEAKDPAVPHGFDQQLLTVYLWAFIVPAVWGFSARWLPGFLRLPQPSANALRTAGLLVVAALAAALFGAWLPSCFLATAAALVATFALHLPQRAAAAPDLAGVHFTFPYFIRVAYAWLVIGSCLSVWAAISDRSGGIWGASRHALTVGFISTMVFSIGQRVLPGFCGTRVLFSRSLMFLSLALLTVGCAMRVAMEPLAYEGYVAGVWRLLPVSATIELTAFTIFAVNLGMSLTRQPERIRLEPRATPQRLRVNGEY